METYEFRDNSIVVAIPFNKLATDTNTPVNAPVATQDSTQVNTQDSNFKMNLVSLILSVLMKYRGVQKRGEVTNINTAQLCGVSVCS